MTTVEERREVARRLRELDYSDLQESLICAYLDALGIKGYEDWIGIAHRLADLIEPSCDRDALLALADEIDANAENIAGYLDSCEGNFSKSDADEYYKLARWVNRIREACGEVGR